jgi:hypothetical protein
LTDLHCLSQKKGKYTGTLDDLRGLLPLGLKFREAFGIVLSHRVQLLEMRSLGTGMLKDIGAHRSFITQGLNENVPPWSGRRGPSKSSLAVSR